MFLASSKENGMNCRICYTLSFFWGTLLEFWGFSGAPPWLRYGFLGGCALATFDVILGMIGNDAQGRKAYLQYFISQNSVHWYYWKFFRPSLVLYDGIVRFKCIKEQQSFIFIVISRLLRHGIGRGSGWSKEARAASVHSDEYDCQYDSDDEPYHDDPVADDDYIAGYNRIMREREEKPQMLTRRMEGSEALCFAFLGTYAAYLIGNLHG